MLVQCFGALQISIIIIMQGVKVLLGMTFVGVGGCEGGVGG